MVALTRTGMIYPRKISIPELSAGLRLNKHRYLFSRPTLSNNGTYMDYTGSIPWPSDDDHAFARVVRESVLLRLQEPR